MSARWVAVQYVGDMLRLPVVNDGDMDKPFGGSVLERDVKRIVVNPFSDNPQTFVPELENAKLRELIADTLLDPREYCEKYGIEYEGWDSANAHIDKRMIEMGVEVPDV